MSEKKEKPTAPEGTGDNANDEIARLRAQLDEAGAVNARLLASQTIVGHPGWTIDQEIRQLGALPTTHLVHARPLPKSKYIALQVASCHTCAIVMCAIGTRSPEYRLIKYDMPPWIDATLGPALRFHPDAQLRVDVDTLNAWGVPPDMRESILVCEAGKPHTQDSGLPYERVTAATTDFFGRGKRGHHNRVHRLRLPVDRLNGLVESEARVYCVPGRFEDIAEGAPLPSWWDEALKPTGEDVVVYEALAVISKTYSRKDDDPLPSVPRDSQGSTFTGRY